MGPATFAFEWKDAKWDSVFAWYGKASGLKFDGKAAPKGTFTARPDRGRKFTLGEVTDFINEVLMEQKLLLVRGVGSFVVVSPDKIDPKLVLAISPEELPVRGRTEIVEVAIPVNDFDAGEAKEELQKLLTPFGAIVLAKGKWLIVRDTTGNVIRIQQTLMDCCWKDALVPPMLPPTIDSGLDVPKPMPKPAAKKFTVHFKDAKWDDVLDWYAKETGLTLTTTAKLTGTFTFVSPERGQQYTLGEITDVLNEGLMAKNFLLVRGQKTFLLHPANKKVDSAHFTRVTLEELPALGRTELVQVLLPVQGITAADALDELKKLLTPFGTMTVRGNCLLISDTVGNVARIQKTLQDVWDK